MSHCHLCDAPLSSGIVVGTTGRHGESFTTAACAQCGLVQTTPLPSEADLSAYYSGPYRQQFTRDPVRGPDGTLHEWGSPEAEALMDAGAAAYAAEIAATLGLASDGLVVEVGGGDFRLSRALKRHVDLVYAVEPGREHRAPDDDGVLVFEGELWEFAETPSDYDAVVCIHVLEHFREPLTALAQMRSLLRPGGRCWLEVPNTAQPYGDLDAHYWQRPHLYNFTAHTLCLLLHRAGFDGVHIADGGHVLYAYATSGEREAMPYADALARFTAATGARVPTGAEVAAHLDDYRASYAKKRRARDAERVLNALRAGEYDVPAEVRDAVELLGSESVRAARIATMAIHGVRELIEMLDGEISTADGFSADDCLQGMRAGQAAMAARCSHTLGRMVNEWKLIEVGDDAAG